MLRARFADTFASRTRDEWAAVFADLDACVTPVLTFGEAASHPHLASRATVVAPGGVPQAAPAPRFSGTPSGPVHPHTDPEPVDAVLAEWRAR